jgi:uncharacterized protein YggE
MPEMDLITVDVSRSEEIAADHADLFVTIEGASLVTGGQALQKAREVAQLVAALGEAGISQDDIHLQGVSAQASSGALLKTSQATYRLRIHCARLERLADALGAVTSQKNTSLSRVVWGYPDEETLKDEWLADCARRAHARAGRVAAGLGVRLTGVHTFTERTSSDAPSGASRIDMETMAAPAFARRRAVEERVSGEELGLEVSHTKRIEIRVRVEYRVSGYREEAA